MLIARSDRPGLMLRLCGLEELERSRSGHRSGAGSLSDQHVTLFPLCAAAPSPTFAVQTGVYLNS